MPDKAAIFMTGKNGDKIYDKDYNTNEKPAYETPDEISIGSLSAGGNSVGKVVVLNEHHKYTYNGTAQHSSVVFKFLYEVADPTTVSCQIHFTDGWLGDKHGGIIWFRDDKNRISKAGGGYLEAAPFTEARAYEVEIGKLYITAGPDTGKYYIYLTVDGTKVLEYVIDEMPVKTAVFTTGTNGDKLCDISYAPDSYETADEISIGDLKKNGNPVGNAIALNENSAYSYEATATHKSVIFKFNYEVTDTSEVSCQFHFSNRYSEDTKHYAGMVWFRPDKTYMRIGEGQYINTEAAFASAGTYTVELGKLYVTAGENVGKYYIYVKVNDKLLLECVANEMPDKANIFTTGTNGDVLYDIDYVDCNGSHTLVKVERKEATCTEEGVIEHWYCTNCGKKFSNAEGTTEITEVSIPKHHTLTKVEAVAATCTEDGSIEHYHCSVCGKNFSDAEGTSEITSIVAPKHHTLERVEAVAPTCTEDGSIAYYHCSVCGKNFSDAEGTNEITDIVDPKHHTLTKVDAVAGTCTAAGNIEHYHCGVCGKNFSDAEGVNEITDIVDPVHHTLSHREAVAPTCTEDGNIEYYHCSECGKNFSDAEGTTQVTNVIIAAHHTLTKVEAKAATCTEAGNIEYYHCSECGKNYSDAEGTIEVAEVTIEPTGHHYDKNGKCTVCGEKDPNFKGCKSSVAVGAFMCLAGLAVLVIRKKREER